MTGELTSLKVAYENEGMSPEEIAEDRALDVLSVKAGLMQCSSVYRKACGQESEDDITLNFSNEDLKRVNETILSLALGSEDDNVRLRAAIYVRDDKKGRKEIVKAVQNNNFNILDFNSIQKSAREQANRIKQSFTQRPSITV